MDTLSTRVAHLLDMGELVRAVFQSCGWRWWNVCVVVVVVCVCGGGRGRGGYTWTMPPNVTQTDELANLAEN